jgi:hypothetical protein
MSFQAKRLRVQLPCGEATVIEEAQHAGAAGLCRIPSLCRFPSNQCLCTLMTPCRFGTDFCELPTGICMWPTRCGWFTCEFGTCGGATIFRCPAGTEQPVDPGTLVVDPEHLPALREALEAQLKEIEKAEQALKERGGQGEG